MGERKTFTWPCTPRISSRHWLHCPACSMRSRVGEEQQPRSCSSPPVASLQAACEGAARGFRGHGALGHPRREHKGLLAICKGLLAVEREDAGCSRQVMRTCPAPPSSSSLNLSSPFLSPPRPSRSFPPSFPLSLPRCSLPLRLYPPPPRLPAIPRGAPAHLTAQP